MSSYLIKKIDFDPDFEPLVGSSLLIQKQVLTGSEKEKVILRRAKDESAKIRKKAANILADAIREKEREKQRGYQEGREEALAELTEKILIADQAGEKALKDAEPQIIRMVMDIAEKVIGRKIKKGAVVDVVKKAIRESVGRKALVRINPADFPMIKEKEGKLLSGLGHTYSISIREDESIPQGGCIVETEMGAVDARLETQLGAIRKALGLA